MITGTFGPETVSQSGKCRVLFVVCYICHFHDKTRDWHSATMPGKTRRTDHVAWIGSNNAEACVKAKARDGHSWIIQKLNVQCLRTVYVRITEQIPLYALAWNIIKIISSFLFLSFLPSFHVLFHTFISEGDSILLQYFTRVSKLLQDCRTKYERGEHSTYVSAARLSSDVGSASVCDTGDEPSRLLKSQSIQAKPNQSNSGTI